METIIDQIRETEVILRTEAQEDGSVNKTHVPNSVTGRAAVAELAPDSLCQKIMAHWGDTPLVSENPPADVDEH